MLARWSEDRARAWTGAWRVGASWKRREDGPKALEVNIYTYIYTCHYHCSFGSFGDPGD